MNDMIRIVLLKNGLSLMAEVESVDLVTESGLALKKPVIVSPESTTSVRFIPYLHFVKEYETGIDIPFSEIMTVCTPLEGLQEKYEAMFSNIARPDSIIKP